jgi:hypothetical protein
LLGDVKHRDEAMELIRSLIEKVELTPRKEGGLDALLHGELARILVLCSTGKPSAGQALAGLSLGFRYDEALVAFGSRRLLCVWCLVART